MAIVDRGPYIRLACVSRATLKQISYYSLFGIWLAAADIVLLNSGLVMDIFPTHASHASNTQYVAFTVLGNR